MSNDAPVSLHDPFAIAKPRQGASSAGGAEPIAGEPVGEFTLALKEEELGNHDRAIDLWIRGLRRNPLNAEAHMRLGLCLAAIGEHDGALGPLLRAMELEPRLREAPVRYALSALHVGCADAAVNLMEEFSQREREYPFGMLVYAAALCCVGKREQAQIVLQTLENSSSSAAEFFRNLSRSLMASGQQQFASAVESPGAKSSGTLASIRPH